MTTFYLVSYSTDAELEDLRDSSWNLYDAAEPRGVVSRDLDRTRVGIKEEVIDLINDGLLDEAYEEDTLEWRKSDAQEMCWELTAEPEGGGNREIVAVMIAREVDVA